jgi:FSR family fosmidomycin resistance protein-like MFS transporter
MRHILRSRKLFAGGGALVLGLLLIEFLDEFFFGVLEAAWPLIRDDLSLTYLQIGLLLSVPRIWGSVAGVALGILGDVWKRRALIIGGGLLFVASLFIISGSVSFAMLMAGLLIFNPASGAFVGLAQATLMDHDTSRYEQNMARWTFAGAAGVALGALTLGGSLEFGMGWRELVMATAVVAALTLLAALKLPLGGASSGRGSYPTPSELRSGILGILSALRRLSVLRWLVLLELANLMGDWLLSYLALYFVDVAQASETQAALGVALWTGVGLLGDLILIPLLERVKGLTYLRYSVVAELMLFIAFLLVPGLLPKLVIVAILGFGNAGWYSILKAQMYEEMPGRSGTVMAVSDASELVSGLMPLVIGLAARSWGLGAAMWLFLAGPVALLVGIPRQRSPLTRSE